MTDALLPSFRQPPLKEVAIGVRFRPLLGIKTVDFARIWSLWRDDYPLVEDQLPLPPIPATASNAAGFSIEVGFALPLPRVWFLNANESRLLQLQRDRLITNWRKMAPKDEYPRYASLRNELVRRIRELEGAIDEKISHITHAEITYINQIDDTTSFEAGFPQFRRHHLAVPSEAHVNLVFPASVASGSSNARMFVAVEPAPSANGTRATLLSLSVQGLPSVQDLDGTTKFLDEAHKHLVQSFDELTSDEMHAKWGRTT